MQVGDFVVRKKYNQDIVFQIYDIKNEIYYLKGVELRLIATASLEDLVQSRFEPMRQDVALDLDNTVLKGKILHVDGDSSYLKMCEDLYKELNVRAVCIHLKEKEMAKQIISLLHMYQPDLLVITGHDSKDEQKRNSISGSHGHLKDRPSG